jgi:hypothetical protein
MGGLRRVRDRGGNHSVAEDQSETAGAGAKALTYRGSPICLYQRVPATPSASFVRFAGQGVTLRAC